MIILEHHGSQLDAGEAPIRGSFCIVPSPTSSHHARPWQLDLAAAATLVAGAAAGSPAVLLLLGESEGVGGHASRPHAAAAVRWRRRPPGLWHERTADDVGRSQKIDLLLPARRSPARPLPSSRNRERRLFYSPVYDNTVTSPRARADFDRRETRAQP